MSLSMTEDDAKKKLCPLTYGNDNFANLIGRCVGSECMLWTQTDPALSGDPARGFCGLHGYTRVVSAPSHERDW